jgi:hypothetical protein
MWWWTPQRFKYVLWAIFIGLVACLKISGVR